MLAGKKTYLIAAASIAYALYGLYSGQMDANETFRIISDSGLFAALRAGVAKVA